MTSEIVAEENMPVRLELLIKKLLEVGGDLRRVSFTLRPSLSNASLLGSDS